jgi:hypothetical protein
MTYNEEEVKELFEVVFKLSAKDINDKLIKVRNRPEIAKRRWFWELLQNAKDAVKKTEQVSVIIRVSKETDGSPYLLFSHNGNPFRYQDAKNLIFPYSDKQDEGDSDKSGRFGTGFLATHILSKKIEVKGVYLKDNSAFDFNFILDRSATDKTILAESINQTWQKFRDNSTQKNNYKYSQVNFETEFKYPLDTESIELVKESILDFQTSIAFALAFIPKVKSLTILNEFENEKIEFHKSQALNISSELTEFLIDKKVSKNGDETTSQIPLIICSDESVNVGIEIEKSFDKTQLKEFPKHHPVLFCPFPLIGANDFPFPVVINSKYFIPKEERNGIWLENTIEGKANQALFERAGKLFEILVKYVSEQNLKNSHLLFKTLKDVPNSPDMDVDWFLKKIQLPIKEFLLNIPIIDNPINGRISILQDKKKVRFPNNVKSEVREQMWDLMNVIMPHLVPNKSEIHHWHSVLWEDCPKVSLNGLSKFISKKETIDNLSNLFDSDKVKTLEWLNDVVSLITKEQESLLSESETAILPNQFGEFKPKDELYLDDNIDLELKEILSDTSRITSKVYDWRIDMLDKSIFLELPSSRTRTVELIGSTIAENIKILLKEENPSNELRDLFSKLLNWLNDNPYKAKNYFKGLRTETLLFKTTNKDKLKHITDLLQKDRDGEISVEELAGINATKLSLLQDPDLELKVRLGEQVIAEQKREKEEFEFKKKTGDVFETLFHQLINQESQLEITKVEGEEDFIIKNLLNQKKFYIELKSIRTSETQINITHRQAKKANTYPQNYFLCVIPNDGGDIDSDYFVANAKFDSKIGTKLSDKVKEAVAFEKPNSGITVEFEDQLLSTYKKHRYKFSIQRYLWGQDNFGEFKNKLLN